MSMQTREQKRTDNDLFSILLTAMCAAGLYSTIAGDLSKPGIDLSLRIVTGLGCTGLITVCILYWIFGRNLR